MTSGRNKTTDGPNPIGRPTKYRKNFHPKSYIELCRQGRTKAEICAEWGISRESMHNWTETHKEFLDAIKLGYELRAAFWTKALGSAAFGKIPNSSAALMIYLSKNICPQDFKDRIEHVHENVEDVGFE